MKRIDIINRINHYLDERGWTPYYLASKSEMVESTLYGMLDSRPEGLPRLESICKVCNGLEISECEFFEFTGDKHLVYVSDDELAWLNIYRDSPEDVAGMLAFKDSVYDKRRVTNKINN